MLHRVHKRNFQFDYINTLIVKLVSSHQVGNPMTFKKLSATDCRWIRSNGELFKRPVAQRLEPRSSSSSSTNVLNNNFLSEENSESNLADGNSHRSHRPLLGQPRDQRIDM